MKYRAANIDLSFDDQGAGEAVLFIHGHIFNRSMWLPQVEALRGRFRTIAPDLRGYGDSPLPPAATLTTLKDFSSDIVALLDYLGVRKATLVGLSMGGQIAMEFAHSFPDRLAGLVLAATFPGAETTEGMAERNRVADRLVSDGVARFGCEMIPKLLSRASMRAYPHIAANVYRMICSTDPSGAAAANRGRASRRDYRETLRTVRVPSLVIVGSDDGYTTVDEARDMHRLLPGSRLEIFDAIGHMPNLEDPQRFNAALLGLLADVQRSTGDSQWSGIAR